MPESMRNRCQRVPGSPEKEEAAKLAAECDLHILIMGGLSWKMSLSSATHIIFLRQTPAKAAPRRLTILSLDSH